MDKVFRSLLKEKLPADVPIESVEILMEPHGEAASHLVRALVGDEGEEAERRAAAIIDGLLAIVRTCLDMAERVPLNQKMAIAMALMPDRFIPVVGRGSTQCIDVLQNILEG